MQVSRRKFFKICAGGMAGTSAAMLGFAPSEALAGSDKWERISWHDAIHKVAKLLKEDRDANWEATNAEGTPVNRWATTGFLTASAASNETALITQKFGRAFGMLVLDNQAST